VVAEFGPGGVSVDFDVFDLGGNPARPTCGISSKYGTTVQHFLDNIETL